MGPDNRPLDLEWLEDFVALADSGNFSRAAEARAIAQPAFSRHIRALEEWVGADLIDRGAHPATLTPAGRRLLPLVEDVLARLVAARIKARMAHDQSVASLRIAVTHALSLSFLPGWLARLEASLQLGAVEMMSDGTAACEELMLQRKVQFLLCHAHPRRRLPGRTAGGRPGGEGAVGVAYPWDLHLVPFPSLAKIVPAATDKARNVRLTGRERHRTVPGACGCVRETARCGMARQGDVGRSDGWIGNASECNVIGWNHEHHCPSHL
ncbi:LysR family transcriptional regulator [Alcaligenaceae bacterium SAGV3]|nr:LysR family transcriptional regulator [Alcaligenaceae bacterium SAGV3]